jgi:phage tail tube protein FII
MSGWIDLKGPVIADTVYAEGQLVAKDVAITMPAITPITADYRAMGTMSLPVPGQFESMETSITKIGVDIGLGRLIRLQSISLELRWVQDSISADGTSKPEGCRAYIRGISKSTPGIGLDPGEKSEIELTYETLRYQLFVGGSELWLIDRLSQIYRVLGQDYYNPIQSLL